jgi:hypothetical protein
VKRHLVADAHLGGELDHAAGHVAGAGDDEADVVHDFEDAFGGGEEVLGAFLHGDAAEEEDDLLVGRVMGGSWLGRPGRSSMPL